MDATASASASAGAAGASAGPPAGSSLSAFLKWMDYAGICWDPSLISFQEGVPGCTGAAWGIFAAADIPEGATMATIPKAAVLSARTCGLARILEAERLGGGLALTIGVLYEAARGPASKWHGYLATLPQSGEPLPMFWSDDQTTELLGGTDAEARAKEDRELLASDFELEVLPLLAKYHNRLGPVAHGWNLQAWMVISSWVASRAFYVDDHHGNALVPLADVYNHKAARVELRGGGGGPGGGKLDGFVVAEHHQQHQQQQGQGDDDDGNSGAEGGEDEDEEQEEGEEGEEAGSGSGSGSGSDAEGEDEDEEDEGDEEDGEDGEASGRPTPSHAELDVPQDQDNSAEGAVAAGSVWGPRPSLPEGEHPAAPAAAAAGGAADAAAAVAAAAEAGGSCSKGCCHHHHHHHRHSRQAGSADKAAGGGCSNNSSAADQKPLPPQAASASAAAAATVANGKPAAAAVAVANGGGGGGRWAALSSAVEASGHNLHLDIGICSLERGGVEVLDVVAAQPLARGAEVYNTYGEHGNADLINKYGFCLPRNPFDEVSLCKESLLAAAEAQLGGKRAASRREGFLMSHSDLLDPDEEPFLLLPPRHVSLPLYLAVAVLAASDAQLAAWQQTKSGMDGPLQPLLDHVRQCKRQQQGSGADTAAAKVTENDGLRGAAAGSGAAAAGGSDGKAGAPAAAAAGSKRRRGGAVAAAAPDHVNATDPGQEDAAVAQQQQHGEAASKRARRSDASGGGRPAARRRGKGKAAHSGNGDEGEEEDGVVDDDAGPAHGPGLDTDLPDDVEVCWAPHEGAQECVDKQSQTQQQQQQQQAQGAASPLSFPGRSRTRAGSNSSTKQRGAAVHGADGGGDSGAGGGAGSTAAPVWTPAMRSLLGSAVSGRLAAYGTTLEHDRQELERLRAAGADGSSTAAAVAAAARRAALTLRVGEKELLTAVVAALAGPGGSQL